MFKGWRYLDPYLFVPAMLLLSIGLVMVYSASGILAEQDYGDSYYFLKRHAIAAAVGLGVLLQLQRINYQVLRRLVYPFLGAAAFLLILVLIPGVGTEAGGAQRWIRLFGFSIQPSEFAKLAVIIFLLMCLRRSKSVFANLRRVSSPWSGSQVR